MIENRDIVIFGDDWARHPSTIQHLGRVFAKKNRLLWISGIGLRSPRLRWSDVLRVIEKLKRRVERTPQDNLPTSVKELHPLVVPFYDIQMVRRRNDRNLQRTILEVMDREQFNSPIILPSTPLVANAIGELRASSTHYLCVDDYSGFDEVYKCIPELEQELLSKVDTVLSVSERLRSSRIPLSGKSYFLPQGVEYEHFSRRGPSLPPEFAEIPRPIVGFFGLLTPWVDVQLIEQCAKTYPTVSFVLIGSATVNVERLKSFGNIFLLGRVPYAKLPAYAQQFDVGLIPFVLNELTLASNPLKLLEYMAVGVPVVSTDLPEVYQFKHVNYVARSPKEFVEMIQMALDDRSDERRSQRQAIAAQHSWEHVAESISRVIQEVEQR